MAESSLLRCFREMDRGGSRSLMMHFEWIRYFTFKSFPTSSPVMPTRLAENGFFYTEVEDIVVCFSCNKSYGGWKQGDVVSEIHKRISPNCHFINKLDVTNVPIHRPGKHDGRWDNVADSVETDGSRSL